MATLICAFGETPEAAIRGAAEDLDVSLLVTAESVGANHAIIRGGTDTLLTVLEALKAAGAPRRRVRVSQPGAGDKTLTTGGSEEARLLRLEILDTLGITEV